MTDPKPPVRITLRHLRKAADWALNPNRDPIQGRTYQQNNWDCGTSCCLAGAVSLLADKVPIRQIEPKKILDRIARVPNFGETFVALCRSARESAVLSLLPSLFSRDFICKPNACINCPITIGTSVVVGASVFFDYANSCGPTHGGEKPEDTIVIGSNVVIDSYSRIEQGCRIGSNAFIGSGCHLEPNSIIEDNVILESDCLIQGGARVPSGTTLKSDTVYARIPLKKEPSRVS